MTYISNIDYKIKHAIDVIYDTYGDNVSVDEKKKDLTKFGRNPNVGSSGYFTIWYTGQDEANETYVAQNTNSIDSISSSSASDTMEIRIEGHTEASGNKTFVAQTKTLSGTTKLTLDTPLNRVTRISVNGSVDNVGEIYVYEDTSISSGKPSDTSKIHITMPIGVNQSQKASTSLSSTDYWIVTRFSAGYLEKTGTNVAEVQLEVRESGGVWKPLSNPIVIKTGEEFERNFNPYKIIPKNADIRLRSNSSTTGQEITGDIGGYLAEVI